MKPACVFVSIAVFLLLAYPSEPGALLITNVNLIDGKGGPIIRNASILIRNGRIAAISRSRAREPRSRAKGSRARGGEEVLDGKGAYALPGLIDSHTHLASVPGAVQRQDSAETKSCLLQHHLHGYLASGVTSVLDNAASLGFVRELERYFAAGGLGPRAFYLAPFLTPPDGYFSDARFRLEAYADLWSPVKTRAEVIAHLEQARQLSPVGVKVAIEDGFGPIATLELHSAGMRKAIQEEARKRHMPLYIHSMSNDAHRMALEMKPRTLVHSLVPNESIEPDVIMAMKKAGVFVVSTIAVYDFLQIQWRQSDLDDPLVQLTVPAMEIETARDSAAWKDQNDALIAFNTPGWIPAFLAKLISRWFYGREMMEETLDSAMKDIKQIYDAGVTVVMGSDSGNWPRVVSYFHGPGTIREMELLAEAGIPPMDVIRSATQRAAQMIGVDSELGTLEVGKLADLIIVESNPLEDISSLRRLAWVVKEGVARRPKEWMALAPKCR